METTKHDQTGEHASEPNTAAAYKLPSKGSYTLRVEATDAIVLRGIDKALSGSNRLAKLASLCNHLVSTKQAISEASILEAAQELWLPQAKEAEDKAAQAEAAAAARKARIRLTRLSIISKKLEAAKAKQAMQDAKAKAARPSEPSKQASLKASGQAAKQAVEVKPKQQAAK